jgi:hypothetical protein
MCLRKIQNNGLQTKYDKVSEFSLQVRLLCALAFIPQNTVIETFDELVESEYYTQNEELLYSIIM